MKKYFSILIAFGFLLASCGGGTNTPATDSTATDSAEVTTPAEEVPVAADPTKALADYKEFVDKFEKAVAGMNKGDTKAIADYSKLLKDAPTVSTLAQEASATFTAAQKTEYEKLVKKYADIIKAMTEKK